ncbi:MAG TPA: VWA domain-containing protein [Pyrinomonadaceae bacterium]|nr:VWA domain-containing protein [Pyrinomonadaceae bacterium]
MSRQKRNVRPFAAIFLLTAMFLLLYSGQRHAGAQEQQQPPPQPTPPLKRMRRVKNQPPKQTPSSTQSAQTQPASEDDVVRVDTDLANILLTAIDKDKRFITTLRKEDVRVFEDNQPQEISDFERETDLPLSLAILIDTSRSQEKVLTDEKVDAHAFIDSVIHPDKDRAAIISFTGEAVLQQDLTGDLEKLRRAAANVIIEIPYGDPRCEENVSIEREPRCWTGVWDAIWVTVNEVLSQTPPHTRRAIIMLTDGDDTSSQTDKQEAIDLAVKNDVVIYSIGIHDKDAEGELAKGALSKVSEKTGGRVFLPQDKAELDVAFAQIQQELRSQYLISYTPSNRRRDGTFRQVKIEITNPELRKEKLRLLYRQGYYAKKG